MKRITVIAFIGVVLIAGLLFAQDINKTVVIVVDADIRDDMIDAFAWQFDYQEIVDGESNPESKQQFANRMFVEQNQEILRSLYKSYMRYKGAEAAALQADTDSLGITVQ